MAGALMHMQRRGRFKLGGMRSIIVSQGTEGRNGSGRNRREEGVFQSYTGTFPLRTVVMGRDQRRWR
jgi:hypothetical protein